MNKCNGCKYWSEMIAHSIDGGPVEAICFNKLSPNHNLYTNFGCRCKEEGMAIDLDIKHLKPQDISPLNLDESEFVSAQKECAISSYEKGINDCIEKIKTIPLPTNNEQNCREIIICGLRELSK
jgi:hypothetical protein